MFHGGRGQGSVGRGRGWNQEDQGLLQGVGRGRGWNQEGQGLLQGVGRGREWNQEGQGLLQGVVRGREWNQEGQGLLQGVVRGREWNQEGPGLLQRSMRKRKREALPEMFEKQVNIRHLPIADADAAQNYQSHWRGSLGVSSLRGMRFVHGFRNSQLNTGRSNAQETYGRRLHASESYSKSYKEDTGNQRQQTTSGDRERDHQQKRHETRTRNAYGQSDLFYLSKTMSYLLRHGALKAGLRMQSDGYVFVSDLLQCKALQGPFTEDDVRRVTEDNDKQRFQLMNDPISKKLMVRANQGHSIESLHLELESITDAREAPIAVHGTFLDIWPTIKQQGLSRMSRNHIHFSVGKAGDRGVISGMRRNCQVLIYINISKALEDGIQFFRSANNVILSPGDSEGFISPKYFDHVEYRLTGKNEQVKELDSRKPIDSPDHQNEDVGQWTSKNKEKKKRK